MKKIIVSLSIIGAVGVIAVGVTTALFSDTETSTGNTFTAGGIDLTVDSFGATRNGQDEPNSTLWSARDLTSQKFFDLGDVKPGDWFGRSISLHVENNPAWACLLVKNIRNNENELTDPEQDAGDVTDGLDAGELGSKIHVLAWRDINPNGTHQSDEPFYIDSFFDVFTELAVTDSTMSRGPLTSIDTEFVQMDLCAGNHIVHATTGAVSCDGSLMNNTAQTDILMANIQLYVVQHRNNPDFKCSDLVSPVVPD